jgi:uncharacterized protein (TIGR04222 family)
MSSDTWGISGPAFLVIYGCLIGLAVLFGLYQYLAARFAADVLAWPWLPKAPPPDSTQHDRYTIAYLVGGTPRVAAVAVAGLVPARVRVDRKGRLSVAASPYHPPSPGRDQRDPATPPQSDSSQAMQTRRTQRIRKVYARRRHTTTRSSRPRWS